MKRRIVIVLIISILMLSNKCFASVINTNEINEMFGLSDVVNELKKYTSEIDLDEIKESILEGKGVDYGIIGNFVYKHLFSEIRRGLKTAISIAILLVMIGVVKSLELEKNGAIAKVVSLITFLILVTMLLKNYNENIRLFSQTVTSLIQIVNVVSPIMLAILIATGEVISSGIIGPFILFLTGIIGFITLKIVVPLLTLSLVFNIISNSSDVIRLERLGNLFKSTAMWVVAVVFALFLGVLSLETSISTSVDGVAIKTTQAAVSNLVPVVGKFLSDSLEVVMGASELIGKSVGFLGIIVIGIVLLIPLIKIIVIVLIYKLLEAFSEAMLLDDKASKTIGAFSKQYTSILGIMTGVGTVFIIAIGIVMSLFGKAIGG